MSKFRKESYVKQRLNADGTWAFQVRVPNHDTKTFSERLYGSPRRAYDEAVLYKNKLLSQEQDSMSHKNNQTISIYEVYDESIDIMPIREETKRKHIIYMNMYFGNLDRPLYSVTKADIIKSLNMAINEQTDDTIKRLLSIWRRIYKTAIVKDYLSFDVTQGIIVPTSQMIDKPKRKVITDRESVNEVQQALKKKCNPVDAKSICMALEIMYYLGLRPCEVFALEKNDIKDGFIEINKELGSDIAETGGYDCSKTNVVRRCKTKSSVRRIPIPQALMKLLSNYHTRTNILLPNNQGDYFDVKVVTDKIHKLKKDFNMYQLRHTLATNLVVNTDADSRTIQEILGHTNFDMSIYYARSNEEKKKSILNLLQ